MKSFMAFMRRFFSQKVTLAVYFTGLVFVVMLLSAIIIGGIGLLLIHLGVIVVGSGRMLAYYVVLMLLTSIILATVISAIISSKSFRPMRTIEKATHQVAKGDFSVCLEECGVWEIDRLTASFNAMVRELGGIETLRSDFINNFSHEFRTPIVSIQGFAELLQEDDFSKEEQSEYLAIIAAEAKRLSGLSSDVLSLSKLENMEIVTEREVFLLDEQLRRVILLMEPKAREKSQRFDVQLEDVHLEGNYSMLQQVWTNLLDNAVKFSSEKSVVSVSLRRNEGKAIVCIRDQGEGMEAEVRAHIFDKFYQGDTSHSKTGNGLGLPLVKRIVQLHAGDIDVMSELGKGTAFTIVLPLD